MSAKGTERMVKGKGSLPQTQWQYHQQLMCLQEIIIMDQSLVMYQLNAKRHKPLLWVEGTNRPRFAPATILAATELHLAKGSWD